MPSIGQQRFVMYKAPEGASVNNIRFTIKSNPVAGRVVGGVSQPGCLGSSY